MFSTKSVEARIAEAIAAADDDESHEVEEAPANVTTASAVPASDEVHAKEVSDLKVRNAELQDQLERERAVPKFIFEDPEFYTQFSEFITSRFFLRRCLNGEGKFLPEEALNELDRRLDEFQTHTCANGTMPATPPTAPTVPGPPVASTKDTNGSKPSKFKKLRSVLSGAPVK